MINCSCNLKCGGKIDITTTYADDMAYLSIKNASGDFASVYLNAYAIKKLIKELQQALKELEQPNV